MKKSEGNWHMKTLNEVDALQNTLESEEEALVKTGQGNEGEWTRVTPRDEKNRKSIWSRDHKSGNVFEE